MEGGAPPRREHGAGPGARGRLGPRGRQVVTSFTIADEASDDVAVSLAVRYPASVAPFWTTVPTLLGAGGTVTAVAASPPPGGTRADIAWDSVAVFGYRTSPASRSC